MDHTAQALLLRYLASMWEEVANQVLPVEFGKEAGKLMTALVITVYKDEYDFDRSRPVPLIASLSGVTRAWLEDFKAVLRGMDLSFLDDPEEGRVRLREAYRMAEVLIFHAHLRASPGRAVQPGGDERSAAS